MRSFTCRSEAKYPENLRCFWPMESVIPKDAGPESRALRETPLGGGDVGSEGKISHGTDVIVAALETPRSVAQAIAFLYGQRPLSRASRCSGLLCYSHLASLGNEKQSKRMGGAYQLLSGVL
jgi:hypothetical protein